MTKEELNKLMESIKDITSNFETSPYSSSKTRFLRDDFDLDATKSPKRYWKPIEQLSELQREARILLIFSTLSRVCKVEGELYYFDTPFQAQMRYDGVMKKEGNFYLLDEDGHYRDVFTSERFAEFIEHMYWDIFEDDKEE